ncbi:MAG TPA: hypothetical protein DCO86_03775 [Spirochaetaceae bacterium]|nr:hypothetical protein [Spirochaetaceae bacterium]
MEENVFENMSPSKALVKLALPAILGQVMLVIYNMADTFFIGMTEDNVKIAAVALCMPALMALNAIANLFGVGAASVISRALGKSNRHRAKNACAFSFWGCVMLTAAFSVCCRIFSDAITDFLGGINPAIHFQSLEYLKYTVVYDGWAISMSVLLSHVFRSMGKSALASAGLIGGGLLNIILDPIFMFSIMESGNEVAGAAIATSISNTLSFSYYIVMLFFLRKKDMALSVKLEKSCFYHKIPSCIFEAGAPAFIMTLVENLSYAVLDRLMATAGTIYQAGIGVAKKVNMLSHSIVRGLTQGALPLLGYAYSTGNRRKTKRVLYITLMFAFGVSATIFAANIVFAPDLISFFIYSDNPSGSHATSFLRMLAIGCPFSAIAYAFISFFQSVGHGKESFALALLRKGVIDIPLMFLLKGIIPIYGIVWATPITDCVCCVASAIVFLGFSKKHLSKNKKRKMYDPETDTYKIIESCEE